jgi:hypothetical protein
MPQLETASRKPGGWPERGLLVPIRFIKRDLGVAKGAKIKTVMRSLVDTAGNWIARGMSYRLKPQPRP